MNKLEKENARLKGRIRVLERTLEIIRSDRKRLRAKQPFRSGLEGEKYIAGLLGGKVSITNARHDVITENGTTFEVKLASLNTPVLTESTRRWTWADVLGRDGKKFYDHLVLLGVPDERYRDDYWGVEDKYVIFDIPYEEVLNLTTRSKNPCNQHQSEKGANSVGICVVL